MIFQETEQLVEDFSLGLGKSGIAIQKYLKINSASLKATKSYSRIGGIWEFSLV